MRWFRSWLARRREARRYAAFMEMRRVERIWREMGRGSMPPVPIRPGEPARWA